jgi:hypothetical protein
LGELIESLAPREKGDVINDRSTGYVTKTPPFDIRHIVLEKSKDRKRFWFGERFDFNRRQRF